MLTKCAARCTFLLLLVFATHFLVGCESNSEYIVPTEPPANVNENEFYFSLPNEYKALYTLPDGTPYEEGILAFCVDDNGSVIVSTGTGHVVIFSQDGSMSQVYDIGIMLYNLVTANDVLYGYVYGASACTNEDCTDETHAHINDGRNFILQLDLKSGDKQMLTLNYDALQVRSAILRNGKMYLLCVPETAVLEDIEGRMIMGEQIVEYDVQNMRTRVVDTGGIAVTAIASLRDNNVLLYGFDNDNIIAELDTIRGNILNRQSESRLGNVYSIGYDDAKEELYYSSPELNAVLRISLKDAEVLSVVSNDVLPLSGNDLLIASGYLYLLDYTTSKVLRTPLASIGNDESIHLTPNSPPVDAGKAPSLSHTGIIIDTSLVYNMQIPGVHAFVEDTGITVNYSRNYSGIRELLSDITSGTIQVDAFVIDARDALSLNILNNGAFYKLENSALDDFYLQTFNWIYELARIDDGYWMIPLAMDTTLIYYNLEKLSEHSIPVETFETLDDIWKTAVSLLDYRTDGRCNVVMRGYMHIYNSFLDPFFNPINNSTADYSSHSFRNALEDCLFWFNRLDEPVIQEFAWMPQGVSGFATPSLDDLVFVVTSGTNAFRFDTLENYEIYDSLRVRPLPTAFDSNAINFMSVLVVNPASEHIGDIMKLVPYITDALMHPSVESRHDGFFSGMFFEDRDMYANVYNARSEQFNDLYEIFSNGYVPVIPSDMYNTYIAGMLFGEITVSEAQRGIVQYMQALHED